MEETTLESKLPILNTKLNKLPENPQGGGCGSAPLGRFPKWLHRDLPKGGSFFKTEDILQKYRLNTVCEEAKCPNRMECYTKKTATFLALGKQCTRACGFCDIDFSKTPKAPEADEPERIALSVKELGLLHVVITMVARDDLEDFGATHIAKIIEAVRHYNPDSSIEVLTSDFCGSHSSLDKILTLQPEVFNHNIETTRRLTPKVRHKATYERTLEVLNYAKKSGGPRFIKSGIMVGLGETPDEVKETLKDLKQTGCDIVTIGHYLQASRLKIPVKAFISPETFKHYEQFGLEIGIPHMYCGPFVRSSYNANLVLKEVIK
jgi:lipoic acid synthetase